MMDILFIGGVFQKEKRNEIFLKSRGVIQFAADSVQWKLINGFDSCNGHPIRILNASFVGSYPRYYKDIFISPCEWNHVFGAQDKSVGFLNIFGIKHIWKGISLARHAILWARITPKQKKAIIVYSMHLPFIFAAAMAKRVNSNIHICLIVPDLPKFMNLQKKKSVIYIVLKILDEKLINYYIKYIDSFVFLTRHMAYALDIGNKPWIVMEGIVDNNDIDTKEEIDINDIGIDIILYTGTLNKVYGIVQLIRAFKIIKNTHCQLWICGEGEAKDEIEIMCEQDHRIRYFGQLKREDVLRLQRKATLLVNPRPSNCEFTKYSFPSKIMEYMASGTPLLTTKLPGIPEEYYNYVYLFEDESVEGMAKTLERILELPKEELHAKGAVAKEFVLREKNNIRQASRILELVENMDR
jgi:glycosyltransferase involved in cell wall biosynthesis